MILFYRPVMILLIVFFFVGCGSQKRVPTFPVTGKVLVNGKPAADLFVYLLRSIIQLSNIGLIMQFLLLFKFSVNIAGA